MTKLSERLEALAEKVPNMCEACGGVGGFEAGGLICCNGSDWECGASGCTGPIDGRYLEQCSVCLGTGQRSPHHHRSTESERPMTQDKETLREAVARGICVECNGIGYVEQIAGWGHPCDACRGKDYLIVPLTAFQQENSDERS